MPLVICPEPCNPCLDPASPLSNFSTYDQDKWVYRSYAMGQFGSIIDEDSGTPGWNPPPLGSVWSSIACGNFYFSTVSQNAADLEAARAAAECLPEIYNPPGYGLFYNDQQTGTVPCPDGSMFSYTVPANTFVSIFNKESANQVAVSYATLKAYLNRFCLADVSPSYACVGSTYGGVIEVVPEGGAYTFELVDGDLPPGLVAGDPAPEGFYIEGTPTTAGAFQFTLKGSNSAGMSIQREFTISVYEIDNSSVLPAYSVGVPYSVTLTVTGPSTDIVWSVVSGSLPPGLNLNASTGVISGTPTA